MGTRPRWTVDQVMALAPDAAAARAARSLTSPRTWSELGSNESLVWGKCQGSGREPYQVTVDLNELAFRCTCPSRKFPCKHGLALLLQWAAGEGSVADTDRTAGFAVAWTSDRAARSRQKHARSGGSSTPADPEAQARRLAEREALMSAGIDDFERWLFDLVRQGLAAARRQPFTFWDTAAGRLVDAQVPGLAERVRIMASEVHRRPDWAEHLLSEAGKWYLAVRAWRLRAELPDDVMGDLRTVLGWSRRTDEVLTGTRVTDRWHVVGLRQDEDERLVSQRTWLRGESTGRTVVLLDFAAAGATLAVAHVLGSVVEGEVALYPGSEPQRARFTGDAQVVDRVGHVHAASTIAAALDQAATWMAANPWNGRIPMALAGVVAVPGDPATVVDSEGAAVPLSVESPLWRLLALSGGEPVDVFGEWMDSQLHPCSMAAGGHLVSL
ncbi:MAG: SWIM zinc finger family protein [Acidimicrobiales bacterium]